MIGNTVGTLFNEVGGCSKIGASVPSANIGVLVIGERVGNDVSSGVKEGETGIGTPIGTPVWLPVGGIAIGVDLKGGFETGVEPDGTVRFIVTGTANGMEPMVGIETGISATGERG